MSFERGMQIIYVPTHAKGNFNHPDCETGFVTSYIRTPSDEIVYCRYWLKHGEGLRTTSCSEKTSADLLVKCNTVSQKLVEKTLEKL